MSEEQINIAIAEACPTIVGLGADGIYYLRTGLVEFDPCNDLNAMHEAEKELTEIQCAFYRQNLHEIITNIPASRYVWHATARKRAEAFLRTIGKWKEGGE